MMRVLFKRFLPLVAAVSTAAILVSGPAFAQGAVQSFGPITYGHGAMFQDPGHIRDAGGPAANGQPALNNALPGTLPLGSAWANSGLGACGFSGYATAAYNRACWGFDGSGNMLLTLDSFGGAPGNSIGVQVNGGPVVSLGGPSSGMKADASNATLPSAINNLGLGAANSPTFANLSLGGALTVTGSAVISGDLTVNGAFSSASLMSTTASNAVLPTTLTNLGLGVANSPEFLGLNLGDVSNPVGTLTVNGDILLRHPFTASPALNGSYDSLIGIGSGALSSITPITTTQYDTAVGSYALQKLTTADHVIAFGSFAGQNLTDTTGSFNTLIGIDAARFVTAAAFNTCVGYQACIGGVLGNNANISYNVAVGSRALASNVSGNQNTAVGKASMDGNNGAVLTGNANSALGYQTLFAIQSTAHDNTAIGGSAGQALTTATQNVFLGSNSGLSITTGSSNTLLGTKAGNQLVIGSRNVVLGEQVASTTLVNGSDNVLIGTNSSIDTATGATSNTIQLGAGSTCIICVTGAGTPSTSTTTISGLTTLTGAVTASSTLNVATAVNDNGTAPTGTAGSGYVRATSPTITTPTFSGTVTSTLVTGLNAPINPTDAANKNYVDGVASGIVTHASAQAATTANLTATASGTGVGKTLTNSGAQAAFAVDGYSASVSDRILVKDQTTQKDNGIYTVTTVGSGASNWVLTRATDFDQASSSEVAQGAAVIIINGTANAKTQWIETGVGPFTVDTTAIVFSQLQAASNGSVNSGTINQFGYYASAGTAISGISLTGLVKGNGASAPGVYAGTTCTNQFVRSLDLNGASTCATVGTSDLASSLSLTTPTLGVASATSINKWTFTAPSTAATLTAGGDNLVYTMPAASKTIMASDYSNASSPGTANSLLTSNGAGIPNAVAITGLVKGNGASAPAAYAGTSCTNQFPRSLDLNGAATCATVGTNDLAASLSLTTPTLGVASATTLNKWTFTAPSTAATLAAGADNLTYTMPSTTQTIVGRTSTDTLTNKTLTDQIDQESHVSTATLTLTTTTLTSVTGFAQALTAGGKYSCHGHLHFTTAPTTSNGVKVALATSDTLTVTTLNFTVMGFNGAAFMTTGVGTATALAATAIASTNVATDLLLNAEIVVNAAGTLQVQLAENVASGTVASTAGSARWECHRAA